jgi:hypothetical protein
MEKGWRRRPAAHNLLDHPFIKQIQGLDLRSVFRDLPETRIDFRGTAGEAETDGELGDGAGGG